VSRHAVLLDLDGTLTDPRAGIVRCIRYALERLQRPCPAEAALASCIGPPLRATFGALLATADGTLIERAMALYRERFAETGLYENEVYEDIPAALDALGRGGHRLVVATSKPAVYAERIVRHFRLDRHFAAIYGPTLDGRFDDKAELLAHVLEAERLVAGDVVMVGDRDADAVAARTNGVRSIGVLWGYGSREELLAAGVDAVCAAPRAQPDGVDAVLRRRGR
jgi:phosphoglycolate phosphatase